MILDKETIIKLAAKTSIHQPIAVFIEPDDRLNVLFAKNLKTRLRIQANPKLLIGKFHNETDPKFIHDALNPQLNTKHLKKAVEA